MNFDFEDEDLFAEEIVGEKADTKKVNNQTQVDENGLYDAEFQYGDLSIYEVNSNKLVNVYCISRKNKQSLHIRKLTISYGMFDLSFFSDKIFNSFNHITIKEVVFNERITNIGSSFCKNLKIEKVTFPSTIRTIEKKAFSDNNLTNVTFPESLKEIGEEAFSSNKIENLILPEGLKEVDGGCFYNNPLKTVILPKSLTRIGIKAFTTYYKNINVICYFTNRISSNNFSNIDGSINSITIIVEDDFDIEEAKRIAAAFKCKITFVGYFNILDLIKIKKINLNVHMTKKKDIINNMNNELNDLSTLNLNKEITDKINQIKAKSKTLDIDTRNNLLTKIDNLVNNYLKELGNLKPTLSLESSNNISLGEDETPKSLTTKLVVELDYILLNLTYSDSNFILKEKLEMYQKIVEKKENLKNPDKIAKMIIDIMNIKWLDEKNIQGQIIDVLNEVKKKLPENYIDNFKLTLETPLDYEEIIITKLKDLTEKINQAKILIETLNGNNPNELSKYLTYIKAVIGYLDDEKKKVYLKKLEYIIETNKLEANLLIVNSDTEIINKIKEQIENKLLEIVPGIVDKRDILEDLNIAKEVILGTETKDLGLISSAIKDLLDTYFKHNLVSQTVKDEVIKRLENTINQSYLVILANNYPIIENESFKNFDNNTQIKLHILKEIYDIKFSLDFYLKDLQEYNEVLGYSL